MDKKTKKIQMSAKNAEKSLFHIFNLKTFVAKDVEILSCKTYICACCKPMTMDDDVTMLKYDC